jgi:hypothetical protein
MPDDIMREIVDICEELEVLRAAVLELRDELLTRRGGWAS